LGVVALCPLPQPVRNKDRDKVIGRNAFKNLFTFFTSLFLFFKVTLRKTKVSFI